MKGRHEHQFYLDEARTAADPTAAVATPVGRQSRDVKPMDAGLVADQQAIADTLYELRLIPKAIRISDALA